MKKATTAPRLHWSWDLTEAAAQLKAKIDAGKAEAQNPLFITSTGARDD